MTAAASSLRVTRYQPDNAAAWDAFVRASKNGTFLHERRYMDYHADRFADHSLLLWQDDQLCALLPAHVRGDGVASHNGLTYGGLLVRIDARLLGVAACFDALVGYLTDAGMSALLYKAIPSIYHRARADEDLFALARLGATLVRRQVLLAVQPAAAPRWSELRVRGTKKAAKAGVTVRECSSDGAGDADDWAGFWALNSANLRERHDAAPVHSLDEITRLARACVGHIRLFVAEIAGVLCAGVLVYESDMVARAQYIASDAHGRTVGALDAVFAHLLRERYPDKPWFDFGSSHTDEAQGLTFALNSGLIAQKEGFGASAILLDTYHLPLVSLPTSGGRTHP